VGCNIPRCFPPDVHRLPGHEDLIIASRWLACQQTKKQIRRQTGMSAREFRTTHCAGVIIKKYMEDYSIERGGIANLDFTGELIGQSGGPNPRVKIYRTKDLKYIGELKADQKLAQAQPFDKPADVISWFKNLNYGAVSSEVQDVIEDATKHDEAFKAIWNEHVD
jgi:hypothetical protein